MVRWVVVAVALVAVAAGAVLWWWMLPPVAPAAALAAAAARVPADADGLLVLATPTRLLRWLLGHRQAVALLLVADPHAGRAARDLEPVALACARAGRGPMLLWWRGDALAVEVEADAGGRRALAELAALKGLAFGTAGDSIAIADSGEILGPPGGRRPPQAQGRHGALALAAGRWWWADASRGRLEAVTGAGAAPPEIEGPSEAVTSAAAPLLGTTGRGIGSRLMVLAGEDAGWAFRLPDAHPSPLLRRLFGADARAGDGRPEPHRLSGLPGDLWVTAGDGVALASSRDLLERVDALAGEGEYGAVRGDDAAWVLDRVAALAGEVPGLGRRARDLRTSAAQLRGLKTANWRLDGAGGTILMEW